MCLMLLNSCESPTDYFYHFFVLEYRFYKNFLIAESDLAICMRSKFPQSINI